ncbi:MAG: DUF72 domain-containing protein [Nannocystaceae bacterium]
MQLRIGSSGFSYDFWRGGFYPRELDDGDMLAYYAARFDTVEINNTFYRMPNAAVLRRWAEVVPAHFRFVIKASRRITHVARLRDVGSDVAYLFRQLEALGDKLGPVLLQCPPFLRADVELLRGFLALLPQGCEPVLEFRHRSWFDASVYDALRERGACLCISDEDRADPPVVATAEVGYLRLRGEDYDDETLRTWLRRMAGWPRSYVFFKHEATAPRLIERARALAAAPAVDPPGGDDDPDRSAPHSTP